MKDKEVKIESSMGERFDKKFTYISSGFLGNEDYISLIEVKINDLKSFIQSEIDLAVANREKEIVERIEKENKTLEYRFYFDSDNKKYKGKFEKYGEYYDFYKFCKKEFRRIINLITTK